MGMVAGMKDTFIDPGCEDDDECDPVIEDLVGDLVSVFDDFLWTYGGTIKNEEPHDSWTDSSLIYGEQREELMSLIHECLGLYGIE